MAAVKTYQATACKDGRWWIIQIPELRATGQADSAREVARVARTMVDLCYAVDGLDEEFAVEIDYELPGEVRADWDEATRQKKAAKAAETVASELARRSVRTLREAGYTYHDMSMVLGLSPQRIHQLLASA